MHVEGNEGREKFDDKRIYYMLDSLPIYNEFSPVVTQNGRHSGQYSNMGVEGKRAGQGGTRKERVGCRTGQEEGGRERGREQSKRHILAPHGWFKVVGRPR